jgi:acyl-CoA hydrolase
VSKVATVTDDRMDVEHVVAVRAPSMFEAKSTKARVSALIDIAHPSLCGRLLAEQARITLV